MVLSRCFEIFNEKKNPQEISIISKNAAQPFDWSLLWWKNKIEYTQTKSKFQLKNRFETITYCKVLYNLSIKSSIKNIILLLFNSRLCAIKLKGETHFASIREKDIAKHLLNTHLEMSRGFSTRVFFLFFSQINSMVFKIPFMMIQLHYT